MTIAFASVHAALARQGVDFGDLNEALRRIHESCEPNIGRAHVNMCRWAYRDERQYARDFNVPIEFGGEA